MCSLNIFFVPDDYDENYDPYAANIEVCDDNRDIKPDVNKFNFKVPSSSALAPSLKRKRGRPRKEQPAASPSPSKRAKKPPRKRRSKKQRNEDDLDDFIDDDDNFEDFVNEDSEHLVDDEDNGNIKTEDGRVAKVPKRKQQDSGRFVFKFLNMIFQFLCFF